MRLKSLLFASTAALFAVGAAANAADAIQAPEAAPAAPEIAYEGSGSVSVCDAMGVGYFVIPGSETCLKLGGAVEAGIVHVNLDGADNTSANIEARMDLDARTESDLGVIGSKLRVSLLGTSGNLANDADVGVELAYITVGPAYVGYKETLFNTKFGYGDLFDPESFLGGLNTLTAGAMVDNIGGGFYVGGAVETTERGLWVASYDDISDVDFVARAGLAGQSWGGTDLSFAYSEALDTWGVKSTTDWDVLESTQLRFTAAYADVASVDVGYLGLGAQHAFTDKVTGFASAGYVVAGYTVPVVTPAATVIPFSVTEEAWLTNAGVTYTAAENFDITGEIGYGQIADTDNYLGQLKFIRSW